MTSLRRCFGTAGFFFCFLLLAVLPAPSQTSAPLPRTATRSGAAAEAAEMTLSDAIDIHVHSGPDSGERAIDADDLARLAKRLGMRGLVLKNKTEATAGMAYLIRKSVPAFELFGGVVLDRAVGGINPTAVRQMLTMEGGTGRFVWLPTTDSEYDAKMRGANEPFVRISADGKLLPEVNEVLDVIAHNSQLILATGHISPEEVRLVVREARSRGISRIVITHAMRRVPGMSIPQMIEVAEQGAFVEFVYGGVLNGIGGTKPDKSVREYADAIHAIGPARCILSTDFGRVGQVPPRPLHPQGLLEFMKALHKEGISVADINLMTKTNPAILLGLAH
jgi:hypothetical protein